MPKKTNFHCNKCGEDFFVSTFITSFPQGKTIYKKENRKTLISCEHCKSIDVEIIKETINYTEVYKNGSCVFIGKYASASPQQKRDILQKRAENHNKKSSSIEESKHREKVQILKTLKNVGK